MMLLTVLYKEIYQVTLPLLTELFLSPLKHFWKTDDEPFFVSESFLNMIFFYAMFWVYWCTIAYLIYGIYDLNSGKDK